MAWRPHARVRVSSRDPRAAGVCDRCGIPTNHYKLRYQFDWSGMQLQNLRILVCAHCYDQPQEQLRAKILSPDPLPIFNARPEPFTTTGFSYDEASIYTIPDPTTPVGTNVNGLQLLLPDGVTVLLLPEPPWQFGPPGYPPIPPQSGGDFNSDFSDDFSGGGGR